MENKKFTHLHVHTEYSLLDGASRISELVKKAKELNMDSLAITDHGVMYGVVEFYKQAKKQGIKPILGFEAYVAHRKMLDKDPHLDKKSGHLILLAENQEGYSNIIKICSAGFVDGFYYKPRIDYDVLKKYSKGIIALSACLFGEVQQNLLNDNYEKAKEKALFYRDIFGDGNFFLEMQDHNMREQLIVNKALVKLSGEIGIPLVATNDVHYINKEDSKFHDVLLCIQMQKTIDEKDRMKFPSDEFYLKSYDEMAELFPKEALDNTQIIAKRCNVDLDFNTIHLPEFPIPSGYSKSSYFRELCQEGIKIRYKDITKEIQDRLDYEISVIEQMGYVDYFLIVWDFIKYARDNGIMVGPGRGSGAGSIIAYALKITNVDPLKYGLLFERFLNPERVSMPDIDIDFCYERREEVIEYVIRKYGADKVAQIVTFGTMAARGAIRDVGRVLNIPYGQVDIIAKKIPMAIGMTITKALELDSELKNYYDSDETIRELIDMALKIEGLPRHTSTHAAGVLISKKDVTEYVPLSRNKDVITTQFNMVELEELGLLKMDFLGLRTLTVIQDAINLIKDNYNISVDFENVQYDDKKIYEMFAKAETLGIFQFESAGMRAFLKEFKPTKFEDIAAANALYRPGPMSQIPTYIQNSISPDKIVYLHPLLENSLEETYGCMVYQEQVMQIVRDIAGFSMGRSDLLRRAMGKKKMDVMQKEREHFIYGKLDENGNVEINGAIRNGISEKVANEIYDLMIDFAKYAFNKSHSVAYAAVAYETAWLKLYYPVEFMASLITSVMGNNNSVALYIRECKRLGIEVMPPDINESEGKFTVNKNKIRFGLKAIKNVGTNVIEDIVKTRAQYGEFTSFTDFCQKVDSTTLNKRQIEALIKSGAFDSLGCKRSQLMIVYEKIISGVVQDKKKNVKGQVSLFDVVSEAGQVEIEVFSEVLPNIDEYSQKDILAFEKEMMGVYLSGHPLSEYEKIIDEKANTNCNEIFEANNDINSEDKTNISDGQMVILGGIIVKKQTKITKNNTTMAFITLEDLYGTIEVIIFPKTYSTYGKFIDEDKLVLVHGSLSLSEEEMPKILCNRIEPLILPKAQEISKIKLFLQVENKNSYDEKKDNIYEILRKYRGNSQVVIYLREEKSKNILSNGLNVDVNSIEMYDDLCQILGRENVVIK